MKKVIIGFLFIVVVVIAIFLTWYNKNLQELRNIKNFNNEYEIFINKEVTGVDVTTVINKAIENNNQYEIEKDSKGLYKNDNENSIEIVVKPEVGGKLYPMEAFEKVGIKEFTKNFGVLMFKSTEVKYHNNGKISKIVYEIQPK